MEQLLVLLGGGTVGVLATALVNYVRGRTQDATEEKRAENEEEQTSIGGFQALTQLLNTTLQQERLDRADMQKRMTKEWEHRLEVAETDCIKQMTTIARDVEKRFEGRIASLERQVHDLGGIPTDG